jgi:N-acetyl-gamma-glutamyl-phosphate/LysW-gamma-L-alpha-aminoadipyl-6-phosphate reductase
VHSAAIVGGSGYVGGELLRLLVDHPDVEVTTITSRSSAGRFARQAHPNLRGRTDLKFVPPTEVGEVDVLFLALGHGESAADIERWSKLGRKLVVDLSADFRLRDAATWKKWYDEPHASPDWLPRFTYGLPELHREELRSARYVSGVGCNATAVNLALLPLERAGLLSREREVIAEVKVGSSEGGAEESAASHHPVRSGCVRSYAPVGHRHAAEVEQTFDGLRLDLSITAIEAVRGALATCHVRLDRDVDERELNRAYQGFAKDEPFVDVVHERAGLYRHPEPKLLAGTNRAQIGFAYDPARRRLVALGAIDNLGKGAAGSAVQAMNLMCGFEETTGLSFRGIHPV